MTGVESSMEVLTLDQCWALLRAVEVGRLAVAIANRPDVFPVNHVVDGGTVVFRTAEGTKLAAAVLGTAVAFEVDGYDAPTNEAWSVVVKGEAREALALVEIFQASELPLFPWVQSPKPRFVRIIPHEVTGRRFTVTRKEPNATG